MRIGIDLIGGYIAVNYQLNLSHSLNVLYDKSTKAEYAIAFLIIQLLAIIYPAKVYFNYWTKDTLLSRNRLRVASCFMAIYSLCMIITTSVFGFLDWYNKTYRKDENNEKYINWIDFFTQIPLNVISFFLYILFLGYCV